MPIKGLQRRTDEQLSGVVQGSMRTAKRPKILQQRIAAWTGLQQLPASHSLERPSARALLFCRAAAPALSIAACLSDIGHSTILVFFRIFYRLPQRRQQHLLITIWPRWMCWPASESTTPAMQVRRLSCPLDWTSARLFVAAWLGLQHRPRRR